MTPPPPLPYQARGLEWLLAVGVLLVTSAAAATTAAFGGDWVRVLLVGMALGLAAASWRAAVVPLSRTEEALAAVAVVLAALGADPGSPLLRGSVWPPAVVGGAFLLLTFLLPGPASWPLAAWGATQVAALRALDGVPDGLPWSTLAIGVALAGLATACLGRPLVARLALVSALPWWVAGVVGAVRTAWLGAGPGRWVPVVLTAAAAVALLVARERPLLRGLLRPPAAVAVLSGTAVGAAVAAALHSPGPVPVPLAGYLGVALASAAATLLRGGWRRVLLPAAFSAGATLAAVCLAQLLAGARWTALTWLLLTTGALSLVTALLRRDERPTAIPTAVACWGLAVLCTVPTGDLGGTRGSAVALGVLYLGALAGGLALETDTRRATVTTGAVCAAGAVVLLVVLRDRGQLAVQLAVQGALTCAWAWVLWRRAIRAARVGSDGSEPEVPAADEQPALDDGVPGPPPGLVAAAVATRDRVRTVRRGVHGLLGVAVPDPDPGAALAPVAESRREESRREERRRAARQRQARQRQARERADRERRPPAPAAPDPEETVPADESLPAWRTGAAQLVVATWTWAALQGWAVLEWYTLPLAGGLLLGAGPRLVRGPSAPAWGPGLWVAAAPSVVWAVLQPGSERPIAVVAVSGVVLGLAAWWSVRAPLVAGALTAVTLALGLLALQLPLTLGAAVVVGSALLGVGAWRELVARQRRREEEAAPEPDPEAADGFRRRLAEMR